MAQSTDSIKKWLNPAYLSRSERNLILALAIALSSTCVGLAFLFTEFLDSSAKAEGQFSASIAGGTLAGYDQSIRLSNAAQEAFVDPLKNASLYPRFGELAKSINSIRTVCRSPLVGPLNKSKGSHGARFDHRLATFDRLIEISEQVFTQSGEIRDECSGIARAQGGVEGEPMGDTPAPTRQMQTIFSQRCECILTAFSARSRWRASFKSKSHKRQLIGSSIGGCSSRLFSSVSGWPLRLFSRGAAANLGRAADGIKRYLSNPLTQFKSSITKGGPSRSIPRTSAGWGRR